MNWLRRYFWYFFGGGESGAQLNPLFFVRVDSNIDQLKLARLTLPQALFYVDIDKLGDGLQLSKVN